MSSLPDPALSSFSRLRYALRGLQRDGPCRHPHTRLPITPELLLKIYKVWSQGPLDYNKIMLWAAFCMGFFGFMHAGELTCPSLEAFSPDMLSPQDVSVDSHVCPSHLAVHLKRSKNDPFAAGTTLHLGATGKTLCPVSSMLGYLAIRPSMPGPLFLSRMAPRYQGPGLSRHCTRLWGRLE